MPRRCRKLRRKTHDNQPSRAHRATVQDRAAADARRTRLLRERAAGLAGLHSRFAALHHAGRNAQQRGYDLEELLGDLCHLYELPYQRPYRTPTEQIDGAFEFKNFTYLIESRWRAKPPDQGDLADFKAKIDSKIESVRGLFLSVAGFRGEVVNRIRYIGRANFILLSGHELALILEGRWQFPDALAEKIRRAEQEGAIWHDLATVNPSPQGSRVCL